jgi:mannose/fructose/N-acetylgalactosamine-specific phosphotransferase system component IIC
MSSASAVAAMTVLGGALGLDTTAALQLMVSEPLVAGTLAGLVLGDPAFGLVIGAALQLVWCGALPVGAAPFPDSGPATVGGVGGALALVGAGVPPGIAVAAGLVVALVAGLAGQRLTTWLRKRNDGLAGLAEERAASGDDGGVKTAVVLGLAARFATAGGLALVTMVALVALSGLLVSVPVRGTFSPFFWVAPLAACVAVAAARCRLERWLLGAGLAAGFVIGALV